MSELKPCPDCGGNDLEWGIDLRNLGMAVDGRLKMNEIGVVFFLGCNECFETITVVSDDIILDRLNTRHTDDKVARLVEALKPFAKFACDEPCHCNNCIARNEIDRIQAESEVGE